MAVKVDLYTDGACSGNPGRGGWAAVLLASGRQKEISGYEPDTTNNRMELTAVIRGLACLKFPCEVTVYSDSAYVINAFRQNWLVNWKRNGWKNASRQEVSNRDLWEQLDSLVERHKVTWVKVKGHSDNKYNNRCDELAVAAYRSQEADVQPKGEPRD